MSLISTSLSESSKKLRRRWVLIFFVVILPCFILLALQTLLILRGSQQFRFQQLDNGTWIVGQLEVDHKNLLISLSTLLIEPQKNDAPLTDLRRVFEVYYSRVDVVRSYIDRTVSGHVEDSTALKKQLSAITTNLEELARRIDSAQTLDHDEVLKLLMTARAATSDIRNLAVDVLMIENEHARDERLAHDGLIEKFIFMNVIVIGILGLMIALLLLAERDALRQAEKMAQVGSMLRKLAHASIDGIVVCDDDGRILEINPAIERIFAYDRNTAIGQHVSDLFSRHRVGGGAQASRSLLRRVSGLGLMQGFARRSDGSVLPVEFSVVDEKGIDGDLVHIGFIRDITQTLAERRRLRRERGNAAAEARDKARIFSTLSHELRTPLQVIAAALALMRDPAREATDEAVRIAEAEVETALDQIDHVIGAALPTPLSSATLVSGFAPVREMTELCDRMRLLASARGLELVLNPSVPAGLRVMGSAAAFRRALRHLLNNAIRFSHTGRIEVRLIAENPGWLRLEVEDEGVGISDHEQARIFDDFIHFGDPLEDGSGLGLGLSVVRDAVRQLNGSLGLASILGEGSAFWIEFPAPSLDPAEGGASARLRVLVVDDNPVNCNMVARMVTSIGHIADEAGSGQEAVVMSGNWRYDLILMDINMPGLDGIAATARIRGHGLSREARIVGVTANVHSRDITRLAESGMAPVLMKPVSIETLTALLNGDSQWTPLPEPPQPETDTVQETLALLREVIGSPQVDQIIVEFLDDCDALLSTDISANRTAAEWRDFGAQAHRCAGMAAIIGATRMHQGLCGLEFTADEADPELVAAGIGECRIYLSRLRGCLL